MTRFQNSAAAQQGLSALLCLIFFAVLIRTAWISDDALITLRTVLNVTHGYGLVFNIAERVQTFTHPLWLAMLSLAYLVVGNVYLTTFTLSMVTSIAVFWIALRRAPSVGHGVLIATLLLFSRAFVDYSTGGLENPLSHLLIALFIVAAVRTADGGAGLTRLWLLASLLYLTRPDDVVMAVPALIWLTWHAPSWAARGRAIVLGLTPAIAWTMFSLVYYGFPFPNTAYAKIATGISARETWTQGVLYLIDSLDRDPLTITAIFFGAAFGLASGGIARAIGIGIVLQLLFVTSVGGDFMAGRFLTVPFIAATLMLGWALQSPRRVAVRWREAALSTVLTIGGLFLVLGLSSAQIPLLSDSRFEDSRVKSNGIVDERAFYFKERSLVKSGRHSFVDPEWPSASEPRAPGFHVVITCGLLGAGGLDQGPLTHMLDDCALADPLLARLPAVYNRDWRIGHFRRMVPAGYRDSLAFQKNLLSDPKLHNYYDDLRTVVASPSLWSRTRWQAIWRLNRGDDGGIDRLYYRHEGALADIGELRTTVADETPPGAPGTRSLEVPLAIRLDARPGRRVLDIALDSNDRHELLFLLGRVVIGTMEIGPVPPHRRRPGLTSYGVELPPSVRRHGFDTMIVSVVDDDGPSAIGHVLLDGEAATQSELNARMAARERAERSGG